MVTRHSTVRSGATKRAFIFDFVRQPPFVAGLREEEQVISAFIAVANVKSLFMEYETRNVPFVHWLKKEPWGQSSFIVRDPDGNCLCFAG
jgi:hypothetical protein